MLKVDLNTINAIEQGIKSAYKVKVYWQEAETYTEGDYLISIGDISTSMSEGSYEIANTIVTLKNEEYYFSKRLSRELPNNKLVEVSLVIPAEVGVQDILIFRGVVNTWQLTELSLTLNINA